METIVYVKIHIEEGHVASTLECIRQLLAVKKLKLLDEMVV